MSEPGRKTLSIRPAVPADAAGIVAVLEVVTRERIHSAIEHAWSVDEERGYIERLSAREVIPVAVDGAGRIVGLQILDRWSSMLSSMAQVGQVGTFLLPEWRGQGVGRQLWDFTSAFAGKAGYRKIVIQVRGANLAAQSFYRSLGFKECGRLTRQVSIDGVEDDEVLLEWFIEGDRE